MWYNYHGNSNERRYLMSLPVRLNYAEVQKDPETGAIALMFEYELPGPPPYKDNLVFDWTPETDVADVLATQLEVKGWAPA
jgi:hypothetical protein